MSVLNSNLLIAAIDIDGTIKDLVVENTNALVSTLKRMNNMHNSKRGKFVLWINKINMWFIKTGMLPTNSFMQNILLFIYSVLLLKKYNVFKKIYFKEYNKENIFFECSDDIIQNIIASDFKVYLITKNNQNKRMLKLKDNNIIKNTQKIIVGNKKLSKYSMYKAFIYTKRISKNHVLIIGDNFWDDVLPGLLLGLTVVWCNMYNSKFKKLAINILKLFFRNIRNERELFMVNKS